MVERETNLPRAVLLGVVVVIAVYLLANIAYLRVLGIAGLAATPAPAAEVMARVLCPGGPGGTRARIQRTALGVLDVVRPVIPCLDHATETDGVCFRREPCLR